MFQDLSNNENRILKTALNNLIKSYEEQLDEKQVVIETLLKNLQNFSYNNIVTTSNHKFDQIFRKNTRSSQGEKKRLARLTNQSRYMTTTATILILKIKKQLENQKKINPKLLVTLLMIATVKK